MSLEMESLKRFRDFKYQITALLSEWAQAYEVSESAIERQISIAHAWCNANPKKAPKKDPVRFLHNWMRIAKKMGNLVTKRSSYQESKSNEDMSFEEMVAIRKSNMEKTELNK